MTKKADDLTRDLNLLWLRAELAALPTGATQDNPVAGLRTFARRALLRAQTGGDDTPTNAELERLIMLLIFDRIWRNKGKMVWDMRSARFKAALDSRTSQPDAFALRLDVTCPGPNPEDDDGQGR